MGFLYVHLSLSIHGRLVSLIFSLCFVFSFKFRRCRNAEIKITDKRTARVRKLDRPRIIYHVVPIHATSESTYHLFVLPTIRERSTNVNADIVEIVVRVIHPDIHERKCHTCGVYFINQLRDHISKFYHVNTSPQYQRTAAEIVHSESVCNHGDHTKSFFYNYD